MRNNFAENINKYFPLFDYPWSSNWTKKRSLIYLSGGQSGIYNTHIIYYNIILHIEVPLETLTSWKRPLEKYLVCDVVNDINITVYLTIVIAFGLINKKADFIRYTRITRYSVQSFNQAAGNKRQNLYEVNVYWFKFKFKICTVQIQWNKK